jgi:hypothetical protein
MVWVAVVAAQFPRLLRRHRQAALERMLFGCEKYCAGADRLMDRSIWSYTRYNPARQPAYSGAGKCTSNDDTVESVSIMTIRAKVRPTR